MLLIAPGKPGFPTYHQDRRERAEHIGDRRRLGRPTVEARLQLPATDTNGRTRDRQESAMQTRPATHACTGVFHAQRRGIRPHQSTTDHESGAMLSTSEVSSFGAAELRELPPTVAHRQVRARTSHAQPRVHRLRGGVERA